MGILQPRGNMNILVQSGRPGFAQNYFVQALGGVRFGDFQHLDGGGKASRGAFWNSAISLWSESFAGIRAP